MQAVNFLATHYQNKKITAGTNFLRIFVMNRYQILSNACTEPSEMITWAFSLIELMYTLHGLNFECRSKLAFLE